MSDDDVIDYMVVEAVTIKAQQEDAEQQDKKAKADWKNDRDHLKQYA